MSHRRTDFAPHTRTPAYPAVGQAAARDVEISRISKIDVLRLAGKQAIDNWISAPADVAPQRLLAVRAVQDQISRAKQRNPRGAAQESALSWVDDWHPPGK